MNKTIYKTIDVGLDTLKDKVYIEETDKLGISISLEGSNNEQFIRIDFYNKTPFPFESKHKFIDKDSTDTPHPEDREPCANSKE